MPVNRLRQPKKVREKLPETAIGKVRRTSHSEAAKTTRTVDGKRLVSLIPVVRKRGRPSLASKLNPTVDLNEALKAVGKGFFFDEEKDMFKTPRKGRPVEHQMQRPADAGLRGSPAWSNKKGAGDGLGSRGSTGSKAVSPDGPYFLRSKGAVDAVVDDSLLHRKRTRTNSVGLASAEKESPARRGRKSVASPPRPLPPPAPRKHTEVEKSPVLIEASKASAVGRDYSPKNAIHGKPAVQNIERDVAKPTAFVRKTTKSETQTKTPPDQQSEELADAAEEAVQVATGKKRKRESDEVDDLMAKRAKVVIIDAANRQEMAREPHGKLTSRPMVLRANDEDLSNKMVLNSEGEQTSCDPQAEEAKRNQEKPGMPTSAETTEVGKRRPKSPAAEVAAVVTGVHLMPSLNRGSVFESVDGGDSVVATVKSRDGAAREVDEMALKKLHNLTANVSVRSSWSAHLYDKMNDLASNAPPFSVAATPQPKSMVMPKPVSAVTPPVDFRVNWDTSAVKDQLLSSLRPPRKKQTDELATGRPDLQTAKEAVGQRSRKRLMEEVAVVSTDSVVAPQREPDVENPLFNRDVLEFRGNVPLEESTVVLANSFATPLRRPDVDKPVCDRDVLEFANDVSVPWSRKVVCSEEERETRRQSTSRQNDTAKAFNIPVQQASVRHAVDRLMPSVDRETVVGGRSVRRGMIEGEATRRPPLKFNGLSVAKDELKPVVQTRGGCGGRVLRRLLCLVGTPVLVIGCGFLVHLAMAAGYLGELF